MNSERRGEPIWRVTQELTELAEFVKLANIGLSHGMAAREHLEIRREFSHLFPPSSRFSSDDQFTAELNHATATEDFARKQHEKGFPYLYATASIRIWSILEQAFDDFLYEHMKAPETLVADKDLVKLEGPLLAFLNATEDERAEQLVAQYKEQARVPLHPGVARLEAMLRPMGLAGSVPEVIQRSLLALSQLRNCLIHKGWTADQRLVERCPWLGYRVGDPILLNSKIFMRMWLAALCYSWLVDIRFAIKWEGAPVEHIADG